MNPAWDADRQWLADAIAGRQPCVPDAASGQTLLRLAQEEGVTVLLAQRIQSHPQCGRFPPALRSDLSESARAAALGQLLFQAEQRAVFSALERAGVDFIVLKGAALGQWLYDSPSHRSVTDIDIWLRDRAAVSALEPVLTALGYAGGAQDPDGVVAYEQAYDKLLHGRIIRVDAHWAMFNCALLDGPEFGQAFARGRAYASGSRHGRMLALNDAVVNSIGHRAMKYISGNGYRLKWLLDQHLLFERLDAGQWQTLTEDCRRFGISDLALDAIEICSARFGTTAPEAVLEALRQQAATEPLSRRCFQTWWRYQWHEMRASGKPVRWFRQRLLPDTEAVRSRFGADEPAWKIQFRRIGFGLRRLLG